MKTIEEKAKAYDDAFERAKQIRNSNPSSGTAIVVCEEIFPELRESEDEELKNKSGYYKAGKFWKACTLWNAVKDKTPQRVPNRYILQECTWNISSLQHFADEVKNVQEVDLNYPIILDMNGNILDGAHRVVKAYLEGKDIDIVYLGDNEWPEPDYDEEKAVKESEDERIRRTLVEYFGPEAQLDLVRGVPIQKIRDWLEKQKEENHDGKKWIYEDDYHKDMERCFNDGKNEVLENPEKYGLQKDKKPISSCDIVPYIDDKIAALQDMWREEKVAFDWDDVKDMIEDVTRHFYQKEQIPYIDFVIKPHKGDDNNPYDMRVSEAQEYAIKRGFGIPFNDGEVFVDERYITQTIGNILRWADEHPKEPKPRIEICPHSIKSKSYRENGVPTESISDELIDIIKGEFEGFRNLLKKKGIDYEPQRVYWEGFARLFDSSAREYVKEQKPAWSEEDEKMLARIIERGQSQIQMFETGLLPEHIAWLKSLRPSWKPSEEQMEALENSTALTEQQGEALYSLVCDLKKLCQ